MPGKRRGRQGGRRPPRKQEPVELTWDPKTQLGRLVKEGDISTMTDALSSGLPLREPEIVDILLPDIEDEVIDVKMVQRMTDSGRRIKFVITVAVGNKDGFIGLGQAKGKEVGSSIKKAIDNAKLNLIEIRRGCGSWECGCRKPHTVPFAVDGKSGSVQVTFKPAPRGIGLATGDVAKKILMLAGVNDCWAFTKGQTKTVVNYAKAVFDALKKNAETRVTDREIRKISIMSGAIGIAEKPEAPPEPTSQAKPSTPDDSPPLKPAEDQPKSEEKSSTPTEESSEPTAPVKDKETPTKEEK